MAWFSVGRAVLCLMVAVPAPAAAQAARSWQMAPHAGVFLPLGGLGDVPISTQLPGVAPEARAAKMQTGASIGVTFLRALSPATRLRLDIDYIPPVDVRVDGYSRTSVVQATGASVVAGIEKTLAHRPGRLEPFVAAGAGFRSYTFQPYLSAGPQFPTVQVSPALRLGAGAIVRVSVVAIGLEAADQLSMFRFEGDGARVLQNDVHALLSVRIGVF